MHLLGATLHQAPHLGDAFARDESGTLIIVFALALMPILAIIGLGVDYGLASSKSAQLQRDIDVAVIAGAEKLATTNSVGKANAAATKRFAATDAAKFAKVSFDISKKTGVVKGNGRFELPTLFLAIVGQPKWTIEADATAKVKTAKQVHNLPKPQVPPQIANMPELDEAQISSLVGRVNQLCGMLERYGMRGKIRECRAVDNGSFEKQLRAKLNANEDPSALLPAGVHLVE